MSRATIKFFLIFAALGFIVSLIAHFSLYLGFNSQKTFPHIWLLLHLSIIVSLAGMIMAARSASWGPEVYTMPSPKIANLALVLFVPFIFYAIFNLFYSNLLINWGYITVYHGQPAIFNKGTLWKILTLEELPKYQRYVARRNSGHWMACHLLASIILSIELRVRQFENGKPRSNNPLSPTP